jgi:hypothetical protein
MRLIDINWLSLVKDPGNPLRVEVRDWHWAGDSGRSYHHAIELEVTGSRQEQGQE